MTFNIITLGCKVNLCESENICSVMTESGFEFTNSFENADIVIVNSCTVTAESNRKVRQILHKVKKANKNCVLVLAGCMPQAEPEKVKALEEVQIIVGNSDKMNIPQILKKYFSNPQKIFDVAPIKNIKCFESNSVNYNPHRSRAFLKIEDGCNRFCSYCIIPYARGRVRSKSLEKIINDVKKLSENGYKEVVLVGINLSSYGLDSEFDIGDVVKETAKISGIERIRLGSLEPDLMTDELTEKLSLEPKFCPQFHLSLQSGSDKILKNMRRLYNRTEYMDLVKKLRLKFKYATFTTDVMVGFPGESEDDFEDTLNLIKEVKFLKVHVFPYSPRPGTPAAVMENQISKKLKSQRVKKVIEISDKSSKLVLKDFLNTNADVLYETQDDDGYFEGYTSNYILVKCKSKEDIRGKLLTTKLVRVENNFCEGVLI